MEDNFSEESLHLGDSDLATDDNATWGYLSENFILWWYRSLDTKEREASAVPALGCKASLLLALSGDFSLLLYCLAGEWGL